MKSFNEILDGRLWGLMRWVQWDGLRRQMVDGGERWYFYAVGEDLPLVPLTGAGLNTALEALDALLRNDHRDSHLGIVYVDDLAAPTFVKIYDPHHMGGCGGGSSLPGWTLSRLAPEIIPHGPVRPENRRRWWRELNQRLVLLCQISPLNPAILNSNPLCGEAWEGLGKRACWGWRAGIGVGWEYYLK